MGSNLRNRLISANLYHILLNFSPCEWVIIIKLKTQAWNSSWGLGMKIKPPEVNAAADTFLEKHIARKNKFCWEQKISQSKVNVRAHLNKLLQKRPCVLPPIDKPLIIMSSNSAVAYFLGCRWLNSLIDGADEAERDGGKIYIEVPPCGFSRRSSRVLKTIRKYLPSIFPSGISLQPDRLQYLAVCWNNHEFAPSSLFSLSIAYFSISLFFNVQWPVL